MSEEIAKMPPTPLEKAEKRVRALEEKLESLGVKGEAKLFYSLNRNMSSLADILDNVVMEEIDLNDPKDKSMERLKIIWAAITPLAETLKLLKTAAGITGDEEKDGQRRPFNDRLAEDRN